MHLQRWISGSASLTLHVLAIATLLLLAGRTSVTVTHSPVRAASALLVPLDIESYVSELKPGGGGGGQHDPEPASLGRLVRFAQEQFAPPTPVVRADNPKLEVEPTLVGPEITLPKSNLPMVGDPNGVPGAPSGGPGSGGGIGSGDRGGVGPGHGPYYGPGNGFGPPVFRSDGAGVTPPQVIYRVEPEFTDAARKARYQGTVTVAIIVDAQGHVRDPRITQPVGMGLDEEALKAVMLWKFKPGTKDGHPVPVFAQILVTFRLL